MAIMGAYSDGCDHANAWLNRVERPLPPQLAACAAWRAHCYAETVRKYEGRDEFLPLLAEWERGFDSTLLEAKQYYAAVGAGSSVPDHATKLRRLVLQANAFSASLAVVELLPEESRKGILLMCLTIANSTAQELAELIGEAVSA